MMPFLALGIYTVHADEDSKVQPAQWSIFAECRMVVLAQKQAIQVINQADSNGAEAWDQVDQLLTSGKAHLIADLVTLQRDGQQAVTDNKASICTPVEFAPLRFPKRLPKEQIAEVFRSWPVLGATPTAFEKMEPGETMSLEAVVSKNGQWADLLLTARDERLTGFSNLDYGELPDGTRLGLKYPNLQSLEDHISIRVRNGEKILFGVHKLSDAEKTFELFLLRLTITHTGG